MKKHRVDQRADDETPSRHEVKSTNPHTRDSYITHANGEKRSCECKPPAWEDLPTSRECSCYTETGAQEHPPAWSVARRGGHGPSARLPQPVRHGGGKKKKKKTVHTHKKKTLSLDDLSGSASFLFVVMCFYGVGDLIALSIRTSLKRRQSITQLTFFMLLSQQRTPTHAYLLNS